MSSSPSSPSEVVAFIGAGNMSTAIVKGLVSRAILPAASIRASSPSGPSPALMELGIIGTKDNREAVRDATIVVFAVKPFLMETAIKSCRDAIPESALVVSVAAGTTTAQIIDWLGPQTGSPNTRPVVRVMPNTPAAIGQGACGICTSPVSSLAATEGQLARVKRIFTAVGQVQTVKESQMDAVTGLSASGPAFVCMLIEALADGGVASGLTRPVAQALAVQMVKGTAMLVEESGQHPGALKDSVASPAGTTIAGIHVLENAGFRGAVMSAVVAASKRATELSAPPAGGDKK